MVYFVYALVLMTLVSFSVTTSSFHLAQTLANYFPKEAAFVCIGSLIIGYSLMNRKTNFIYSNKYLFWFLCLVIVQFFMNYYIPMFNIDDNGRYPIVLWPIKPTLNIIIGVLLIKVLAEHLTGKDWVKIFKFLCWTGFILSVYALSQWCEIDPIFKNFQKNFVNKGMTRSQLMFTFLSHKTLTAAFIALTAPLCLMFNENKYKVFLGIMVLAVILADSILAMAGLFVALTIYLLIRKNIKTAILVTVIAVLIAGYFGITTKHFFSDNGRMAVWQRSTADVLNNSPLVGFGHGSFQKKYSDTILVLFAHNDYVQELNEGGIVGLLIVSLFIYHLVLKFFYVVFEKFFIVDIVLLCCLCVLLIICFGSFPFHYAPLAVIGILYISYIESRNTNWRLT